MSLISPALAEGFFTMEPSRKPQGKRKTLQTVLFRARQSAPPWGTDAGVSEARGIFERLLRRNLFRFPVGYVHLPFCA